MVELDQMAEPRKGSAADAAQERSGAQEMENSGFLNRVNEVLKTDFRNCSECGICSAVCPAKPFMEFAPMRVVQLVLLEGRSRLVAAPDAFACTNCGFCTQYCPVGLPVAELFDFLRDEIRKTDGHPKRQKQEKFAREVLTSLEQWGRLEGSDLGWSSGGAKGGGILGIFGKGEKRQPLNVVRDVPSVYDFFKRLRGEPVEPTDKKATDKKGMRR